MSTDDKSIKFYKTKAQEYAAQVRSPKDSVYHAYYEKPAMYSLLPDLINKTVLSIGCGSGEDSIYLKKQGAEKSIGIDLSDELIDIAKDSYPECEFHVMNMEKLGFPDSSFDFAYSSLAIHYVEDWSIVFKEVFRVLKPNSHFLFSCGHPVRFALSNEKTDDYSTKKLEVRKNNHTGEIIITGDYLTKKKALDAMGKDTVNLWVMPVGDIATLAIDAGFAIERLIEPRPLEKLKSIDPKTYNILSKIPEFIIFKLRKV
ncbi:MAG TPA: class I SAM-dependent methyltransferase [Candidatus Paceibacterota bacterium]